MFNKKASFSAVLKKSFDLFFDNIRIFSLATFICMGSFALAVGSLVLGVFPLTEAAKNSLPVFASGKVILPYIIIGMVCMLFFFWTAIGLYRMIFDLYDTGHSQLRRLFDVSFGQAGRVLIMGILSAIVVGSLLGLAFLGKISGNPFLLVCAITALLMAAFCFAWRLSFVLCFIMDQDLGLFEAIKESMRIAKPYMWELFFVTFGLTAVTTSPIISLFLMPIINIVFICFYRAITADEHATLHHIESDNQE